MKKYILFVVMTSIGLLGFTSVSHAQGGALVSSAGKVADLAPKIESAVNAAALAATKNLAFDAGKAAAFSGVDTHVLKLPAGKVGTGSGVITNIPVKGASQSLLPTVSAKKGQATNLVTPGGMIPAYIVPSGSDIALPITSNAMSVGDVEASKKIADLLEGTGKFEGAGDFYRLAQELPDLIIISHGQLTAGQMKNVQEFYSGCLDGFRETENLWSKMTAEQWTDMVTVMAAVGFFGRAEDVDRIYNIVKDSSKEYRMLTDYVAVRTLLNMHERGIWKADRILVDLAHKRAIEERWFEKAVPQSEKRTEVVYGEVRRYLEQKNPKDPLLKDLCKANTSAVDFPMTLKEESLLDWSLKTNFVTHMQFTNLSSVDKSLRVLTDFLKLKKEIPPLLPDLAK